jgi:hypothetical protein
MMDDEDRHRAVSWFVAGYLANDDGDTRRGDRREDARAVAGTYLAKHNRGQCLDCGRKGVVLLDGFFCERCHWPARTAFDRHDQLLEGDDG